MDPKRLRIAIAIPRSGSTLFMRVMASHTDVSVTSRTILMGKIAQGQRILNALRGKPFQPDYRIYSGPNSKDPHPVWDEFLKTGKSVLISKEETGYNRMIGGREVNECNYPFFPNSQAVLDTRPVFIAREPVRCFHSWKSQGWINLDSFLLAYRSFINSLKMAQTLIPETPIVCYENVVSSHSATDQVYRNVCTHWGISNGLTFTFSQDFGKEFLFWSGREKENYEGRRAKKVFETVRSSTKIVDKKYKYNLVNGYEQTRIQRELGDVYQHLAEHAASQGSQRGEESASYKSHDN